MTKTDAKKIIAVMMAAYPSYNPSDTELTANVWATSLKEYDYEKVCNALMAHIRSDTSGFAPTIGQVMDKIHMMESPMELGEGEAWAMVRQAIGNGGYHAEEEFQKLPRAARRAVGSPSQLRAWALSDDFSESVVASQFLRAYRIEVQREAEVAKMPKAVRDAVAVANNWVVDGNPQPAEIEERKTDGIPMPKQIREMVEGWENGANDGGK